MPSSRNIPIAGVVVLAALLGGRAVTHGAVATFACADVVRYHGTLYAGTFVGRPLHRGARVHAIRPGCRVAPGAKARDVGVTAAQIVGVAPALALLASDSARHVYLVSGVFPQNPNHPLHIALYGNRARPNECLGARTLGPVHVQGTVTATPLAFGLLSVRTTAGATRHFSVDATTLLGFPSTRRLLKGTQLDVTGMRCVLPNGTEPILVARRIRLR